MAESIRITVRPSAAHPDVLTVQDAMRQVLDIFELLSGSDSERVIWALVDATMNSPLTVEGRAISLVPDVDPGPIARVQKARFTRNLRQLRRGSAPRDWSYGPRLSAVRRLMQRSVKGVGGTDIRIFEKAAPVSLTPSDANIGLIALNCTRETYELLDEDRAREEYGSVEGTLLLAGFEYNQPAIQIEERTSRREIWCRVSQEERDRIAEATDFRDVWDHRRVVVRGRIVYGRSGEIVRIYATSVTRMQPRVVAVEELRDPQFTRGLSIPRYLELLREGELGF